MSARWVAKPPGAPLPGTVLVPAKLHPPVHRLEMVTREAVLATLIETPRRAVLVSAPPGSGKTVVLRQWAHAESRPVAWLRLDAGDNDPTVLLAYLATAVGDVAPLPFDALDVLHRPRPRVHDVLLPALAVGLQRAPPFVLILDECQALQNEDCWRHIDFVLDQLPRGATMAMGTRVDPPLPIGRLRAEGELEEIRFPELALDRDETDRLLRLHGWFLDHRQLASLHEVTEGWATGIYLAMLAGRHHAADQWVDHVRGDQEELASYLLGEALDRQPEDLQAFLLRTAILDELSGSLCTAVTGRQDAGAVLESLAHENLFVSPADDRGEWYRYHHLFAELLHTRLERREPALLPDLHRAAADWYLAHDAPVRAVRHWLAAGDVDAAAAPAARASAALLERGKVESARRLISLFTEEQLLRDPQLAVTAAWLYTTAVGTPEEQRRWTDLLSDLHFTNDDSVDGAASLLSSYTVLLSELAPEGVAQMHDGFKWCTTVETRRGSPWWLAAWRGYAQALYLQGKTERAKRILLDLDAGTGDPEARAGLLAWQALLAMDAGDWGAAEALLARADACHPTVGPDAVPSHAADLARQLAEARRMAHDDDPGLPAFVAGVSRFMGRMVPQAPWLVVLASVMLGEVTLDGGDVGAARAWVERAEDHLATYADSGALARRARRLHGAVDERAFGDLPSPAESRVLELLPTHLTLGQIAAQLYLSRNTVKTHLASLRRKLKAGSRAAVVARARELGLLK